MGKENDVWRVKRSYKGLGNVCRVRVLQGEGGLWRRERVVEGR